MVSVGGESVAREFGVDVRASGAGVVEFLEHEDAGPFPDDEPAAVPVKGSRGGRRVVVE